MMIWDAIHRFLSTAWPLWESSNSPMQRRVILTVRSAQLALAAMVLAAITAPVISNLYNGLFLRPAALILLSFVFIIWSWHGMWRPLHLVIEAPGTMPTTARTAPISLRMVIYFTVQLGLAALICHQSFYGQEWPIAWMVMLPPIAHSVILLRRAGIFVVCVSTVAVFNYSVVSHFGWPMLRISLLEFSFAVLFTIVFTLLSVSSEKNRQKVERLASELAKANEKLREYAVQAGELAASRERNRLAGEIHDSLGHYLTVVNVQLEAARALRSSDTDASYAALAKAQSLTLDGLREIRRSVASIRASPLDNCSLSEALRRVVDENRTAGLDVTIEVLGQSRRLSPQAELTFYRAAQEGLTNVRKHAGTAKAQLILDFQEPSKVVLTISDKGVGVAVETPGTVGFGLLGLRERANLLGGEVRMRAEKGRGFTLEVEAPT